MLKQKEVRRLKNGQSIWQALADSADLPGESLPGQCIVELMGDRRVLVEHHRGVQEYSRETIGVRVNYGVLQISGCDLELVQMTREQLIVRGTVHQLTLCRRDRK